VSDSQRLKKTRRRKICKVENENKGRKAKRGDANLFDFTDKCEEVLGEEGECG